MGSSSQTNGEALYDFFVSLNAPSYFMLSIFVTAIFWALFSGAGIVTEVLPSWALAIVATCLILIFLACRATQMMRVFWTLVAITALIVLQSGATAFLTGDIDFRPFGKIPSLGEFVQMFAWFGVVAYVVGGIMSIYILIDRARARTRFQPS